MKTTTTVCSFPNISPICNIKDGLRRGQYASLYNHITGKTVPLTKLTVEKKLHIVLFNRTIGDEEYIVLLRAEGKQPCQNAPQYLLGLMSVVPEDKMPPELQNIDFVAAEQCNASSVFEDHFDLRCFLGVVRYHPHRKLTMVRVNGVWRSSWAFLAEDLA